MGHPLGEGKPVRDPDVGVLAVSTMAEPVDAGTLAFAEDTVRFAIAEQEVPSVDYALPIVMEEYQRRGREIEQLRKERDTWEMGLLAAMSDHLDEKTAKRVQERINVIVYGGEHRGE